jgi:hypothetical protein
MRRPFQCGSLGCWLIVVIGCNGQSLPIIRVCRLADKTDAAVGEETIHGWPVIESTNVIDRQLLTDLMSAVEDPGNFSKGAIYACGDPRPQMAILLGSGDDYTEVLIDLCYAEFHTRRSNEETLPLSSKGQTLFPELFTRAFPEQPNPRTGERYRKSPHDAGN